MPSSSRRAHPGSHPVLSFPSPTPAHVSSPTPSFPSESAKKVLHRLIDRLQVLVHTNPEKLGMLEIWATYYCQDPLPRVHTFESVYQRFVELRRVIDQQTADARPETIHAFEQLVRTMADEDRRRSLWNRLQSMTPSELVYIEDTVTHVELVRRVRQQMVVK